MKLKNLIAVTLITVTCFSCTKEVYVEVPVEPEEVGISRIKIGINPQNLSTKAGHYNNEPTSDENKIHNYALFIFKASGMLETSLIATPSPGGTNPQVYPAGGLTFTKAENPNNPYLDDDGVLSLSSGTKLFFAIVNAPAELLEVQEDYLTNNTLTQQTAVNEKINFQNLSTIVGSYDATTDGGIVKFTNQNGNNRGFMMTTLDAKGYEERRLFETAEGAAPEVIELSVGRAMAKVSLGTELPDSIDSNVQPNGTLKVLSYKIINNPKSMYLMPHYQSGVLVTPYYYDSDVVPGNYFESHSNYVANMSSNTSTIEENFLPVSIEGEKTFTYCIENANRTPKNGNATIAVVKGEFAPGGQAVIFDNPKDRADQSPSTGTIPSGTTFYRLWLNQHIDQNTGLIAGNRYDGYYYLDATEAQVTDYITAAAATNGWPADIQIDIHKYKDGICYYRLPLYNNNPDAQMAPYTVKRNSYYRIDIVSVMDAGEPGENEGGGGGVDPGEPLEPQSNIEAKIIVEKWDDVNQGGNL